MTSCAWSRAPSLASSRLTWVLVVAMVTCRACAISGFDRPRPIRVSTSRSRPVTPARAATACLGREPADLFRNSGIRMRAGPGQTAPRPAREYSAGLSPCLPVSDSGDPSESPKVARHGYVEEDRHQTDRSRSDHRMAAGLAVQGSDRQLSRILGCAVALDLHRLQVAQRAEASIAC